MFAVLRTKHEEYLPRYSIYTRSISSRFWPTPFILQYNRCFQMLSCGDY